MSTLFYVFLIKHLYLVLSDAMVHGKIDKKWTSNREDKK